MSDKWYDKTIGQVESQLKTSASSGLSREEVRKRRNRAGTNDIYPIPRTSFRAYLKSLLSDFTSILLFITVLIAAAFKQTFGILVMAAVILIYYFIAIFTYVKAQRILERMGDYALPNAKVLRAGKIYMVKLAQLVQGDVIFLSTGDIVPCDARLIETSDFEVLETNLTSVTKAARKDASFIEHHDIAPAEQKNMVFASTIVTSGTAKAIACNVGSDTLVCAMKKNTPLISHDKLSILNTLKKYCRIWSLTMSAMIFFITVLDIILGFAQRSIFDSFMAGLSLAVSSMSEFYAAFGYIIIACGIFGAVKKYKDINSGALIKNSAKLEALKDVTCLIVPKEGAFSVMDMQVERVFANEEFYSVGEHGFERNASPVLQCAILSTGVYGADKLIINNLSNENIYTPEEDAIIAACENCGIYNIELDKNYPLLEHFSATPSLPFEVSLVNSNGTNTVAVRGEAKALLERCRYISENGKTVSLSHDKLEDIKIMVAMATKEGARVIAVASNTTQFNNLQKINTILTNLTLHGFIILKEPMLPGAAKNISKCLSAGIKVIMLTGDTCENNRYLAQSLGIVRDETEVIDSSQLSSMKEGLLRANLPLYHLYQGLNISQKRMLLQYLKESGEKVAVLGGGLDDIMLIKEADVGMAQSMTISARAGQGGIDLTKLKVSMFSKSSKPRKTGCEALKFVSDVIISEADLSGTGGFNAITGALMCAKGIYQNLLRMTKYLMVSQLSRILLVLYGVISGTTLLSPAQILICGLIVDFAAVLIISFERPLPDILSSKDNAEKILNHPFTSYPQSIMFGLFWGAATVLMQILLFRYSVITSADQALSCSFFSYVMTQLVVLNETIRERSILRPNIKLNRVYTVSLLVIVSILILCILIPEFGIMLQVVRFPAMAWCGVFAVPVSVLILYEIYKAITN